MILFLLVGKNEFSDAVATFGKSYTSVEEKLTEN